MATSPCKSQLPHTALAPSHQAACINCTNHMPTAAGKILTLLSPTVVSQHKWEKGRRISQVSTAQRWKNQVTRAPTAKQHSFAELDTKIEAKASKLLFNPLVAPDSFTSRCFLLPAAGSWTTIRDQTQAKDTSLNHS